MLDCRAVAPVDLTPLDEMVARLQKVVAASPADGTVLSWIEVRRGREGSAKRRRDSFERLERTLLVQVTERGRLGYHRTGTVRAGEMESAVRAALAQARMAPSTPAANGPTSTPAVAPTASPSAPPDPASLFDEALAELSPEGARDLLQKLAGKGELARLGWAEGRVVVVGSGGLARSVRVTAADLEVVRGRAPAAGRAAGAARSLAGLAAASIFERARSREAPETTGDTPAGPVTLLLSPEAAATLVDLLNRQALSSAAFHDGTSFFRGRLGDTVFHPAINLRDDGNDPAGLPFPFDLLGATKRSVDLVAGGVALTPAIDERLAKELGRPSTAHALSPDEAVATHLFLLPGAGDDTELARQAGERSGLFVGALDPVECFDPRRLRFRAVARGVRRLESGGVPGQALPDLAWEDELPEVLRRILEVGRAAQVVAGPDPVLGGISAPHLAVSEVANLRHVAVDPSQT
ncbi:MAG TPA: metallopeptidase TldD-related protein [Thermoanaerobaculia bacterium]|nr:metallopeptidase TldD-related protein [Thermoanaerobaculia bacterium]